MAIEQTVRQSISFSATRKIRNCRSLKGPKSLPKDLLPSGFAAEARNDIFVMVMKRVEVYTAWSRLSSLVKIGRHFFVPSGQVLHAASLKNEVESRLPDST